MDATGREPSCALAFLSTMMAYDQKAIPHSLYHPVPWPIDCVDAITGKPIVSYGLAIMATNELS